MKYLLALFLVVLCLLLFGFAIKNAEPVALYYYLGFRWEAPLSLMLLVSFLAGMVIGILLSLQPIIRLRKRILALMRELRTLRPNNQS
jgi:lipopolysaccharide assembly protein A